MNTLRSAHVASTIARPEQKGLPRSKTMASTFAGAIAALSIGVAHGATLTVTSLGDSGPGSLREAIATSKFLDNSAARAGGAIHNFDTLTITRSTFSENFASVVSENISNGNQGALKVTNSNIVCDTVACFGSSNALVSSDRLTVRR